MKTQDVKNKQMVSYSKEAGTTYRNWESGSVKKSDAAIEIIVGPNITSEEILNLFSTMSRLHENFLGNPLAVEKCKKMSGVI